MDTKFQDIGLSREEMCQMMAISGNCPECGSVATVLPTGFLVLKQFNTYRCSKCGHEVEAPMKLVAEMAAWPACA